MVRVGLKEMAENKGFEPSNELPRYTLSKRAPSTTRPILRLINDQLSNNDEVV